MPQMTTDESRAKANYIEARRLYQEACSIEQTAERNLREAKTNKMKAAEALGEARTRFLADAVGEPYDPDGDFMSPLL